MAEIYLVVVLFHRKKGKNKSKPYGLKNKELALRFDKKRDNTTAGSKRVK
jgi:hypothetical protein